MLNRELTLEMLLEEAERREALGELDIDAYSPET